MSQVQPVAVHLSVPDTLADVQARREGPLRISWEPPIRNGEYDSINIPRAGRRAWPVHYSLNETFAAVGHPPRLSTNGEVVLRLADELCQGEPGLLRAMLVDPLCAAGALRLMRTAAPTLESLLPQPKWFRLRGGTDLTRALVLAEPPGSFERNFPQVTVDMTREERGTARLAQISALRQARDELGEIANRLIEHALSDPHRFWSITRSEIWRETQQIAFNTIDPELISDRFPQSTRRLVRLAALNMMDDRDTMIALGDALSPSFKTSKIFKLDKDTIASLVQHEVSRDGIAEIVPFGVVLYISGSDCSAARENSNDLHSEMLGATLFSDRAYLAPLRGRITEVGCDPKFLDRIDKHVSEKLTALPKSQELTRRHELSHVIFHNFVAVDDTLSLASALELLSQRCAKLSHDELDYHKKFAFKFGRSFADVARDEMCAHLRENPSSIIGVWGPSRLGLTNAAVSQEGITAQLWVRTDLSAGQKRKIFGFYQEALSDAWYSVQQHQSLVGQLDRLDDDGEIFMPRETLVSLMHQIPAHRKREFGVKVEPSGQQLCVELQEYSSAVAKIYNSMCALCGAMESTDCTRWPIDGLVRANLTKQIVAMTEDLKDSLSPARFEMVAKNAEEALEVDIVFQSKKSFNAALNSLRKYCDDELLPIVQATFNSACIVSAAGRLRNCTRTDTARELADSLEYIIDSGSPIPRAELRQTRQILYGLEFNGPLADVRNSLLQTLGKIDQRLDYGGPDFKHRAPGMILPTLIQIEQGSAPAAFAQRVIELLPSFDHEAWDAYCSDFLLKALRGRTSIAALIEVAHKSPRESDVSFALSRLQRLLPENDLTRQESIKLNQVLRDIGDLPLSKWPNAQSACRLLQKAIDRCAAR